MTRSTRPEPDREAQRQAAADEAAEILARRRKAEAKRKADDESKPAD